MGPSSTIKICSFKNCGYEGEFSLANFFGFHYTGQDSPLFFCMKHFTTMGQLYIRYKQSEQSYALSHLVERKGYCAPNIWLATQLWIVINLRVRFARLLKNHLRCSPGHVRWVRKLKDVLHTYCCVCGFVYMNPECVC